MDWPESCNQSYLLAAFLTIYKSFLRPHLHYGDVIYDHAFIKSFQSKLASVQYNATLAIMGAIRGSSREKLYQELKNWVDV